MTTLKSPVVKILRTLDEDPKVQFFPWEMAVRTAAAALCKTITPRGLLSAVLNEAQGDSYSANISLDPQSGLPVIAPRFTPPVHVTINDTMTHAGLYAARTSNDQLLEWTKIEEALKTAIIESLGPVISQIIQHAEDGFTLVTIRDIMDKLRAKYGRMRKNTKLALKERMTARLSSTEAFDTHVSTLRENFTISYIGGQIINEDKKVDYLRESVSGHVLIDKALSQYDFEHPDETTQTFEGIVAYVEEHLPNLQTASKVTAQATANIMTSEAYLTLEAENKSLKEQQKTNHNQTKKRKGGKGKGKQKRNKKGKRDKNDKADPASDKPLKYCHAHGTQHTHTSAECQGCPRIYCGNAKCQGCPAPPWR